MRQIDVKHMGVFWYRDAEQYARFLEIFEDADKLPNTFPQWQKKAIKLLESVTHQGHAATKIYSTPQEFKDWCMANGAALNAESRSKFASSKVELETKGHKSLLHAIHRANQSD